MSTDLIIPEKDLYAVLCTSLEYANSYFSMLAKSINSPKPRFDNDFLYNLAIMSTEKYFVALLARYDWNASHHMPLAMYKEALDFDSELPESIKQTAIFVGKFEAICSIDGFGYRTPSHQDLQEMVKGIEELKEWVEKRKDEISYLFSK
ncbi:hypothetical protein IR148_16640 [Dysgonomonas mossii]|uniref:HEPN domain-containing protein n=1 Tax=Dysgonomonas mossii TaxID=163665 RepID=A0A4Y9II34_9BACT|nr:hypothetical protein [Dysgonomonas mossii]MBF0762665.1 hypothetical protein [Dysgonomonas mossii]TFU86910.1 hypothetical protein E4T88_16615 [Dysgonomonas mossii]